MIKNGILIKFTSLEGTLTDNDKTILGNKHAICSDDERELYVPLRDSYDLSEFIQQVSTRKENIDKSYTFYFYAHLINGRVVRTKGMQKYQITAK